MTNMPATSNTKAQSFLTRAHGYALTRSGSKGRSWRRVFAGVDEGQDPKRALAQNVDFCHHLTLEGVREPPYAWEGEGGGLELSVEPDGRLRIDCGPELRTDEEVPFLKNVRLHKRRRMSERYGEMSTEETLEYLGADLQWERLKQYPETPPDQLWHDLFEPIRRKTELEDIFPDAIGALTSNHTMLSDEIDRRKPGEGIASCGRVYYYDSYQIRDPVMELLKKGKIHLDVTD